jgi:hypothetical protein
MLVQCLYASRAIEAVTDATIKDILEQSRRNNLAAGITGLLCHTDESFIQVVEGGRSEVSDLLCRIMRDRRHCDVTLLTFDEIQERAFSEWSMGQVNLDKLNPAHLLKYSARPKLDPVAGSGRIMLAFLFDMIAHGGIVAR